MSGQILNPWDAHGYQVETIKHDLWHPQSMNWLDVGLGKTMIGLTVTQERMDRMQVYGTVIFGPPRVCQLVWAQEAKKWSHLQHLTFSRVMGNARDRHYALRTKADVYLVSYHNMRWLVDEVAHIWLSRGQYPPFNAAIFDEISMLKDPSTHRHKALRKLLPYIPYRIGLTATPASNGYRDLFGQYLAVDSGYRLGTSKTDFESEFFSKDKYSYDVTPKAGAEDEIKQRIADITLQISLPNQPEPLFNDIEVELPAKVRQQYQSLENDMFIQLDNGAEIEVFNAAALTNKCLQAANGACYIEPGNPRYEILHDAKLDALAEILEESQGQPVLCMYAFQSDLKRIRARFPQAVYLGGQLKQNEIEQLQADWNEGKIPLMVGHPKSMGHGLNLQEGPGHTMVWYGLNWSLDLYDQAIGRLNRQGQKHLVIVHRILAKGTLDYAVKDALEEKAYTQDDLKRTINRYRLQLARAA